jgi:hypothetical protein
MNSRITVVETVYHQPGDMQPSSVSPRFTRWLGSDEQPYIRTITLTEEWVALDQGWLKGQCGMVVIENEESKRLTFIPTPDEQDEIEARVIEVGYRGHKDQGGGSFLVYPRENLRITPSDPDRIELRCRQGKARCTLHVYPR